jgi:hypothetical protein
LDSSVFEQTEFLLRTQVTGTRSLTQQVLADPAIAGIAALTAHQLAEATLRNHYTFASWLFEQSASEVFGITAVDQTRTVEQPFGNTYRKSLGRGNTRGVSGNRV